MVWPVTKRAEISAVAKVCSEFVKFQKSLASALPFQIIILTSTVPRIESLPPDLQVEKIMYSASESEIDSEVGLCPYECCCVSTADLVIHNGKANKPPCRLDGRPYGAVALEVSTAVLHDSLRDAVQVSVSEKTNA